MKFTRIGHGLAAAFLMTVFTGASAHAAVNLLHNPGFEDGRQGWYSNPWGAVSVSTVVDTAMAHSGDKSLSITVRSLPPNAGFLYGQHFNFQPGHTYQASLWVSSPKGATVELFLRDTGNYFFTPTCKTLQAPANSVWRLITMQGGFDYAVRGGTFGIYLHSTGTVRIDDASLTDITSDTHAPATTAAIPRSFFGIHLNHFGQYHAMLPIGAGMLRLWDCGCRWDQIEPNAPVSGVHAYNWRYMDQLIEDAAQGHASVIYTLGGGIPRWASTNPDKKAIYGIGSGGPPDLNDWTIWLQTVARRYKGRVAYYELWNEADGQGYTGTPEQMVQLARAAYATIKAIDPNAEILSPNITYHGLPFLDAFLQAGGGRYFDIVSWHRYNTTGQVGKIPGGPPENDKPLVDGLHSLMNNYGIRDKPLFCTEGSGGKGDSDDEFRGFVARKYITLWAWGVGNFDWYCWDIYNPLCESDDKTPNAGGIAYREAVQWLVGAQMLAADQDFDGNGSWRVEIARSGGYRGYILWNPNASTSRSYAIPAAWNAVQERDLSGTARALGRVATVTLGVAPVIVENKIIKPQIFSP